MCFDVKPTGTIELIAPDPLLHNLSLPLHHTFYPLGFPVEIYTNDQEILVMAEESWSACVQRFDKPPIHLRIAVSDENPGARPSPPVFRAQAHLLSIVSDPANFAVCDLSAGFSFCCLTRAAVSAHVWARHFFLDAMVFCSLNYRYVTAVHAGCISRNGHGTLLCGPSGIGKSVLALACAKNGWAFVTDDVVYLVRGSEEQMVLGKPDRMKFLPTGAVLFPSVPWPEPGADHDGTPFLELRTEDADIAVAQSCRADYLVFLRRPNHRAPRLVPIGSDEVFARLLADMPVFEKSIHAAHRKSLEILARVPAFELQYDQLEEAIGILNRLMGDRQ
jgi:hypothetical protein